MIHHQFHIGMNIEMACIEKASLRFVGILAGQMVVDDEMQAVDLHLPTVVFTKDSNLTYI